VRVQDGGIAAVAGGHVRRAWLDLAAAGLASDDEADLGSGGGAEGHRRAALGLHRGRLWLGLARGGA